MVKVVQSIAIFLLLCAVVVVKSTVRSAEESKRFFTRLDESSRQFRFALCVLTTSHSLINWKWLHQLHNHDIAVYILEDKDENQLLVKNYITFLSIETEMTRNSGFSNGNLVHRVVQAWDKALFFFTKVSRSYEFVWFMEYDVYIPSLKAFVDVHNMAMHQRSDFVVREKELVDNKWIPWRVGDDFHMDRPWYHSLVCASGLSRRLLGDVLEYTRTYHQLEMIEVLFHTITHHKKYNIYLPRQFETINFNPQGYVNWNCNDVLTTHSDMWYHPIKNQTKFLSDCNLTYNPSAAPSVIPSSPPK